MVLGNVIIYIVLIAGILAMALFIVKDIYEVISNLRRKQNDKKVLDLIKGTEEGVIEGKFNTEEKKGNHSGVRDVGGFHTGVRYLKEEFEDILLIDMDDYLIIEGQEDEKGTYKRVSYELKEGKIDSVKDKRTYDKYYIYV